MSPAYDSPVTVAEGAEQVPGAVSPTGTGTDTSSSPSTFGLLHRFFSAAPLAVAMVDRDLCLSEANEDFVRLLDRPSHELVGHPIGEVLPGLAATIVPAVEDVIASGHGRQRVEASDYGGVLGDERYWRCSIYPVHATDGALEGVGLFLVDVTVERQAAQDLVGRARQLAAVASLGQRALAGRSLVSLLDDAVRLVATTLRVEAAQAFELLPGGDVLLLRAASGVPDDLIGTAVIDAGRESQSGYTLLTGAPVVCEDLPHDARFARPGHAAALGLRSGITVVIGASASSPWGVLGAHSVSGRPFSTDDVHFLELVANVLGVAHQRQRAEDEVRESHARLDLSLQAGHLVSWQSELLTGEIRWDGAPFEVFGFGADALPASRQEVLSLIHDEDRAEVESMLARAVADGADYRVEFRLQRPRNELVWVEMQGQVVSDAANVPSRLVGVVADVTERRLVEEIKATLLESEHRARLEAEAVRERMSILAEAGPVLAQSLDPAATLTTLGQLVLERIGDAVTVYSQDDGKLHEVLLEHRDPAKAALLVDIRRRRTDAGGEGIWSARRAVRTGRSELVEHITDEDLRAVAVDDEYLGWLRDLAPCSAISLPLLARGRILGAMTLLRTGEGAPFTPEDLALVEDLAVRAGMAVDNARLFESRSAVARTLQRSLLPPALPEIPGLEVASRYRAAGGNIEIGGDFYDLFELDGEAWAVVIGDVCGKGTVAAALTGLIRHTIRAAAVRERRPSRVLRFTNTVILDQIEDTRFCTAAFLRVVPGSASLHITASSAGHPLPLVIRADGSVERVEAAGMLIGVVSDPALLDVDIDLGPGEAVVLYTDGVTEARRGSELFGEGRLIEVLEGATDVDAAGITDLVESAVEDFQGEAANDDTAVLVLRVRPARDESGSVLA